jgi:thiopeptide-type bacteriocin biosynthesis protein
MYEPMSWVMVRAPFLSLDHPITEPDDGSLLPTDLLARLAILVGSEDLFSALERTRPDSSSAPRLQRKLLRYLIRMSSRPTPFGLFAGVGLARWGDATDLQMTTATLRTRTRPDMAWLLEWVEELERDPSIRHELKLNASEWVILRAGRAVMTGTSASDVSIRATDAVRRVLAAARVPTQFHELVSGTARELNANEKDVERLLDELWELGFLRTDLVPPLAGGDPAAYVCDRLRGIATDEARAAVSGLDDLTRRLRAWDGLPAADRLRDWLPLRAYQKTLHHRVTDLLQTDLALDMGGTTVIDSVGREACHAAELLLKLTPFPTGPSHLNTYRNAFVGRYGPDREVPLLEMLDRTRGIGTPTYGARSEPDASYDESRQQLLLDIALMANRDGTPTVELTEEQVVTLANVRPEARQCPPSLEISLFIATESAEAMDRGDFQVVVGPNLGASGAGRGLGRFADLLGSNGQTALDEVVSDEQRLHPGCIVAEVVYQPASNRSANVAIRPPSRSHHVFIGSSRGDAANVPLEELTVSVREGRFAVSWPAAQAQIIATQGHMLNPMLAPAPARFLLEVAGDGRPAFTQFSWGPAVSFPFLPRVQHGRVVLSLAQWHIRPTGVLAPEDSDEFARGVADWRAKSSVPQHVYLAESDNRLLLDLDRPSQVELLREELVKLPTGASAVIQEALPGPAHAWLAGESGGHICELVVPMRRTEPEKSVSSEREPVFGQPARSARLRSPGSDWLYLKLECDLSSEDEIIAEHMRTFGEFAIGAGLCTGWFFVRYTDPHHHLRIRFRGEPTHLLGELMEQICSWAGELIAADLCTKFSFETYERELERYGGEAATTVAEDLFCLDSVFSAHLLKLLRSNDFGLDALTLTMISIDAMLRCLGLDELSRYDFLKAIAPNTRHGGEMYRKRKSDLRSTFGNGAVPAELLRVLEARGAAMVAPVATLDDLFNRREISVGRDMLLHSYIHMHVNRVQGIERDQELLAFELLQRTYAGLSHAPTDTRKRQAPGGDPVPSRRHPRSG